MSAAGGRILRRWLLVLTCPPDVAVQFADQANRLADSAAGRGVVAVSRAGAHLPGSVGPGGPGYWTWDLALTTWVDLREVPAVAAVLEAHPQVVVADQIALTPLRQHITDAGGDGPRVKRTLLLRLRPDARRDLVGLWQEALVAMPEHIEEIRSWALSGAQAASGAWTHAWEQEFDTAEDVHGAYLHHPYHLTAVDGWFDPMSPHAVVDPELSHTYYAAPGPVLMPAQRLLPAD